MGATFVGRAYCIDRWPTCSPTSCRPRRAAEEPSRACAAGRPAAARRSLDEVVGQEHLTGPDGAIGRMVAAGKLSSMILWGPPGTGKTSIARLLADAVGLRFVAICRRCSPASPTSRRCSPRPSGRGEGGPAHLAVRGRDPPLQPRAAGRLPALCRGRHDHAGRRDDREPELRAQRRAARRAARC